MGSRRGVPRSVLAPIPQVSIDELVIDLSQSFRRHGWSWVGLLPQLRTQSKFWTTNGIINDHTLFKAMGWERAVDLTGIKHRNIILGNMIAVPVVGVVQMAILYSGIQLREADPLATGLGEASIG